MKAAFCQGALAMLTEEGKAPRGLCPAPHLGACKFPAPCPSFPHSLLGAGKGTRRSALGFWWLTSLPAAGGERGEEESRGKNIKKQFSSNISFLFQREPFWEEVFKINNVLSFSLSIPKTHGLN